MKITKILAIAIGLMVLTTHSAWAHSKITTTPENAAMLDKSPEFIDIKFTKKVRMLKFSILDAEGNEIEYKAQAGKKPVSIYKAEIDNLPAGEYFIIWRAMGKDGHPMKNKFSFTIR